MTDPIDQAELDQLVAIKTGLQPSSAQLLKGVLASHGMPAYVSSEHMGTIGFGLGSDLLVRRADVPRAKSLLEHVAAMPITGAAPVREAVMMERACSQCGSSHVQDYIGSVPTLLPFVKIEALPDSGWYRCRQCGSHFRERPTRFQSLPTGFIWALVVAGIVVGFMMLINWLRWL